MIRYFLISNMYPSSKFPGYGSFVKNVTNKLEQYNVTSIGKALIYGKPKGCIQKIYKYLIFYCSIVKYIFLDINFIYIHFPNQAIPLLWLLFQFHKRKIIINFHGEDLLYSKHGYGKFLGQATLKFCKKYANGIIVPSFYYKNLLNKHNIINPDNIIVSPSGGINHSIFYPKIKPRLDSILHIGYFGRLEEGKGYKEFLEACLMIKENNNLQFKATLIGYGSKQEEVIRYIKKNQLNQIITLLPGVSQSEIGEYYRDLDLFIFSSSRKAESLGLTGIEAMACGIPVIGSDIGGIRSYLIDGYNGWLVPIHDSKAIVERIYNYLKLNSDEITKIKQNCILTGKEYYSEKVCENLSKQIISIIKD